MELTDRVVVVTGAGSGIGEAIARAAHAAGARHVVVADLHGDQAERVADDIGGTAVAIDVRDEAAIVAMVESTLDAHGPIDLFVSNAGFVTAAGVEDSNEAIQAMWEVHCMAHIYAARAVLPSMIARGEGYLLNTASAAGLLSQIGSMAYSMTKAAAISLAEWLAISHHHQGIRVSVLCPQAVRTNIVRNSPQNSMAAHPPIRPTTRGLRAVSRAATVCSTRPTSHSCVCRRSATSSSSSSPTRRSQPTSSARRPTATAGSPGCVASSRPSTPTATSPATRSPPDAPTSHPLLDGGEGGVPSESGGRGAGCLTCHMTQVSESVRLETVTADVGDIALVIVDNPPVNALSWHVRQGLYDGITQAVDGGASAIVVICDGRTFIAGADISEFGGNVPQAAGLHEVQAAMEDAAIPVIAAIHGTALGGGLEVALCAHYRVALSSSKFGLPEVNLGLLPGAGGTQRLPRLVGVPKALEMMTSGRHIGTAEALEGGLIDDVTTATPPSCATAAIAFANRAVAENLPLARGPRPRRQGR